MAHPRGHGALLRAHHGDHRRHGPCDLGVAPARFRPLPERRNVVLSRTAGYDAPGAEVVADLDVALGLGTDVWVAGGQAVYAAALACADVLVVTEVDLDVAVTPGRPSW